MKQYEAKKIKNIVLAGHGGCGKTSVAEAMMYLAGAIIRFFIRNMESSMAVILISNCA